MVSVLAVWLDQINRECRLSRAPIRRAASLWHLAIENCLDSNSHFLSFIGGAVVAGLMNPQAVPHKLVPTYGPSK